MMGSLFCLIEPYLIVSHLFFVLEICYLVQLTIIEAFNPPGSARTDIK